MTLQTDPEGNTTRFTYDNMGNILTMQDDTQYATGKKWLYEYDLKGRLTKTTDPNGKVTLIANDGVGNVTARTNPLLKTTFFEYNQSNVMTKMTDDSGKATINTYDGDNNLINVRDPEGKETSYVYDLDGRLVKTVDGNGNSVINIYDTANTGCGTCAVNTEQPSRTIFPTFTRDYRYDVRGRRILEQDNLNAADSVLTQFTYDTAGNLISKTDKESKTTTYEYDALRRLKKVIDHLSQTTEYTYDNRDNLIALKDAKGQTTTFAYDKNNRLIRETRPMTQPTNYQYDTAGRLKTKTDAKGQTTVYGYDDAGRMTQSVQTDTSNNTKTINFTYDDAGNLKTYSDGTSSATYGYDNLNRKTSETTNYGTFSLTTSYSYNANGTKKSFTYPASAGQSPTTIEYSYDQNNQIAGVNIPNAGYITYGAYQWTRPKSITLPGGGTRLFNYDALMRTQAITGKDPGQNQIMSYNYAYDKMDNIKTRNTPAGNYAYNYDDLYRLSDVQKDTQSTEAYTYDQVGNRTTSAVASGDWTYNANNELLSLPGQSSPVTYQYDANGNTIQKNDNGQIQNYIYNVDNRLVEVQDASGNTIAKYTYDPFGRRIKKVVSPAGGGSGVETYYLYSDEGLIGEYDTAGNEIKTYGYKPNSTWSTDPVFCHSNEGGNPDYYFYHNDHLGTPQKMTDISGAVVWSATYDAFGKATVDAASTITNNLRFPGQYYDAETGWHYNGARIYMSDTGIYTSRDPLLEINPLSAKNALNPIKGNFAHPISLYNIGSLKNLPILFHPYLYGRSSPLNYKDPTGYSASCTLCHVSCFLGGFLACHEVCWWMVLTGPAGIPSFLLCEVACETIAYLTCDQVCIESGACCKK